MSTCMNGCLFCTFGSSNSRSRGCFGMLGDGGETNEEDAAGAAAAAAVLMTYERRNPDLTRLTWVTLDESLNAANGGDANGDGGRSNTLNSQVNKK